MKAAFLEMMRAQLGEGFEQFLSAISDAPPTSIRYNPLKNRAIRDAPVPWSSQGAYLAERPVFTLDPLLHGGAYYVQEASSMFLETALRQACALDKPLRVLDLCAAPGGKSTLLASIIGPDSLLVANETIKSRVSALQENMAKWGCANVLLTNHDAADFNKLKGFFDVLVIDAPCSGEGLFRKDGQAAEAWSPEGVAHCAARQRRILADAVPLLKPGGLLVYSTCTYNDMENMENVQWLMCDFDFQSIKLDVDIKWGIVEKSNEGAYGYQCYPHLVQGEGFFLACLRKEGEEIETFSPEKNKLSFKNLRQATRKERGLLEKWLSPEFDAELFINSKDEVYALPTNILPAFAQLDAAIWRKSSGLLLGTLRREVFVPSHELALSHVLHGDVPSVELSKEDAIMYLKKSPFDLESDLQGWAIMRYQGVNLGWAKILKNRINNYYPTDWRIRMQ
jgi:16S rRNA C967 or C1407 C5-methylase (RsmB/RsmF family)/NOL1/NOP2/fmu family ribosome biogenesis protein